MSSRQIKKLRAQEELARKAALSNTTDETLDNDSEESEDEITARPARPKNAFAAFAALEDEDQDDDEEDDNGDEQKEEEAEVAAKEASPEPIAKTAPSKKKKKKNKKKGKAAKEGEEPGKATVGSGSGSGNGSGKGKDLDEIDRALEELNLRNKSDGGALVSGADKTSAPQHLVRVDLQNLRVMNELRDVFGRTILETAHAEEVANGPANPRARGERLVNVDLETFFRAPAQGYTHRGLLPQSAGIIAKRNPFIQWKDTWPRATSGGLSMRQVGTPDAHGVVEYTFVHGNEYISLEEQFQTMILVAHADTNMLFNFLKQFPFHISSLIVVSIFARTHDQNPTLAADLLERALFSFGRATLSAFRTALTDASGGKARMSFKRPENRQFALVGHHYIRTLMGRGTFTTALGWAKLFLSVMPGDEYGMLLFAQSAAVQSFDSQWFVNYMATFDKPSADNIWPMLDYIKQSVVPAKLQLEDKEGARAALHDGVKRVPWLYGALFQSMNLDVPRAVWAVLPRNETETLYTELYTEMAKALWTTVAMDFVKSELADMAKVDIDLAPPTFPATQTIARFVYLANTPSLMGLVTPKSLLHSQPNSDFDPLPPKREDNIFSYPGQQRPWAIVENEEESKRQGRGNANNNNIAGIIAAAMAAAGGAQGAGAWRGDAAAAEGDGDGAGAGGIRGWLDYLLDFAGRQDGVELDPAVIAAMEQEFEELQGAEDYEGDDVESDGELPELLEASEVNRADEAEEAEPHAEDNDNHAPRGNMPGGWFD